MSRDFRVIMKGKDDYPCETFRDALLYYLNKLGDCKKTGDGISAIVCMHIKLCKPNSNDVVGIISFGAIKKLGEESRFIDSHGMLQWGIYSMYDLPREEIEKFFLEHHIERDLNASIPITP